MAQSAHVTSIEALHQLRGTLIRFAETAAAATDALRQESLKVQEWISMDRPTFWRNETRRRFNGVAEARARLESAQRRVFDNQGPSCIEEKVALRRAKQRLLSAEDKVKIVRKWSESLQRESDEYRSRIGCLETILLGELPRAIAQLDHMIESLERYSEVTRSTGSETSTPSATESQAPTEDS